MLASFNRRIDMRKNEIALYQRQIDQLTEKMHYCDRMIMKLR